MSLSCFCDHCSNNTCTTSNNGFCFAEVKLNQDLQLEKRFNCINNQERLFLNIICDEGTSQLKQSSKFTKCCNTEDFCNQKSGFINDSYIESILLNQPQKAEQQLGHPWDILPQYSNLNKSILICILGFLLIFTIALLQNYFSRWRKSQNRQLTDHAEDHSENSSNAANSEAAIYDTNSMASREPLINSHNNTTNSSSSGGNNQQANQLNNHLSSNNQIISNLQSTTLNHPLPHKGPWMADDTYNGKTQSTFQMSIGSGDTRNKPETSSGSGSGQPYLTQRSIAHDIELVEVVGRGYFGVVWRGQYKGAPVAVKIFSTLAESSWEREAEIYQTTLLRHKNILGFIATDKRDDVSMTGYWLVTDYYPMGSLYDFLKANSLAMPDAIRMAFSIANGLSHLHVEIFGTQGKPAIAHRDLKSKNILVKNDGTCCIADLGMAVRYNSNNGVVDVPANTRVGTRRYLAPELLENKLNLMDFEAVKATDVYALGLVLWEILRRSCYMHPSDINNINHSLRSQTPSPVLSDGELNQLQKTTTNDATTIPIDPETTQAPNLAPSSLPNGLVDNEQAAKSDSSSDTAPSSTETLESQYVSLPKSSDNCDPNQATALLNGELEQQQQQQQAQQNPIDTAEPSIEESSHELAIVCEPYEPPYNQHVSIDPTTDEMWHVVCELKIRPTISYRWTKFAPMRDYATIMRECWYEKPAARLSALRIRKTLGIIARHYYNMNMEYD